jgi:outer membrane murein-binding lipoprotein Lpp
MGGLGFDRQVFVKTKQAAPPPSRSPLPGALVLILVAALGAFAAYRYIKAGGISSASVNNSAQVKQLQQKIADLEAQITQLKKERRHTIVRSSAAEVNAKKPVLKPVSLAVAEKPTSNPIRDSSAEPAPRPVVHVAEPTAPKEVDSVPAQAKSSSDAVASGVSKPDPALSRLQGDLAANHQEWEATVNRLGSVVGELDTQRSQVKQNQAVVNQILKSSQRTEIPFSLKKESQFQRVGPIAIRLADTNVQNQRYTLRMIVDDKSVELKDRALNEVIQFYTEHSQSPAQLVVSQIKRGEVSGMLSVPSGSHP